MWDDCYQGLGSVHHWPRTPAGFYLKGLPKKSRKAPGALERGRLQGQVLPQPVSLEVLTKTRPERLIEIFFRLSPDLFLTRARRSTGSLSAPFRVSPSFSVSCFLAVCLSVCLSLSLSLSLCLELVATLNFARDLHNVRSRRGFKHHWASPVSHPEQEGYHSQIQF